MTRCTHQGCGKDYTESENNETSCSFHPGGPVFHEGLKSWSCCKDTNKPVLDFESFMALPGCSTDKHSSVVPAKPAALPPSAEKAAPGPSAISSNGVESYGAPSKPAPVASSSRLPSPAAAQKPEPPKEELDSIDSKVPKDARCKRRGCGAAWKGENQASRGELSEEECRYHPGGPIFHEGSKGYLCCKRRVLDFDDFLSMPGCRLTSHLFIGAPPDPDKADQEELVDCRLDHYQTPMQVIVSAFAKGADKERSRVTFTAEQVQLDLYLPSRKRVTKIIELYGEIDPVKSTYKILGTKVEMILQKPSPTSWSLLAKPSNGAAPPPGFALTFGVSGRTGTVGGKEIVMEEGKRI